jgi:hypothetical protein
MKKCSANGALWVRNAGTTYYAVTVNGGALPRTAK